VLSEAQIFCIFLAVESESVAAGVPVSTFESSIEELPDMLQRQSCGEYAWMVWGKAEPDAGGARGRHRYSKPPTVVTA
jgi:hypothetical protein